MFLKSYYIPSRIVNTSHGGLRGHFHIPLILEMGYINNVHISPLKIIPSIYVEDLAVKTVSTLSESFVHQRGDGEEDRI
jgi:hypothetical protein